MRAIQPFAPVYANRVAHATRKLTISRVSDIPGTVSPVARRAALVNPINPRLYSRPFPAKLRYSYRMNACAQTRIPSQHCPKTGTLSEKDVSLSEKRTMQYQMLMILPFDNASCAESAQLRQKTGGTRHSCVRFLSRAPRGCLSNWHFPTFACTQTRYEQQNLAIAIFCSEGQI